jgi:hypothetical protein
MCIPLNVKDVVIYTTEYVYGDGGRIKGYWFPERHHFFENRKSNFKYAFHVAKS